MASPELKLFKDVPSTFGGHGGAWGNNVGLDAPVLRSADAAEAGDAVPAIVYQYAFWSDGQSQTAKRAHPALLADMVVPGAMMSGLMRPSCVGPMLLKLAMLSQRSA